MANSEGMMPEFVMILVAYDLSEQKTRIVVVQFCSQSVAKVTLKKYEFIMFYHMDLEPFDAFCLFQKTYKNTDFFRFFWKVSQLGPA